MTEEQLAEAFCRFDGFVEGFREGEDRCTSANLRLKEEHTGRVREEVRGLAARLGWPEGRVRLAEAAALFHDIARFPQFVEFGTFQDRVSRDHGRWGREILEEEGLLDSAFEASPPLSTEERECILRAVELHNRRSLPEGLEPGLRELCRVLRDADKIDILYVVTSQRLGPRGLEPRGLEPDGLKSEERRGDGGAGRGDRSFHPELARAVIEGRSADNRLVESAADMHLLQLTWLYDLNFPFSLTILQERGLVEKLLAQLPSDGELRREEAAQLAEVRQAVRGI